MPDKDRERYCLSQLRKCLSAIPAVEPFEPEPPDFLFRTDDGNLGIELTSFFYPPDPSEQPQQQLQSLRKYITKKAEEFHAEAGGPALYVSVYFNDHYQLRNKDVARIAGQLANSVLAASVPRVLQAQNVYLSSSMELPPEIIDVRVNGSVDGTDRLWYATSSGWVAPISPDHVQLEINRKLPKAVAARKLCDEFWLVIVNDAFEKGAPAELTDAARTHTYTHTFDRLLWLEPHIPRVLDLRCSPDLAP
ncbi:hypothetical protein GMST_05020 [Geomonas silvestris]|uniref:Uncharacterized protein n=1 Tax=Geomonas silvestris TaxID=2740184 RepID=A0A6V8MDZ2_9BACT|nr:hypothetical protein [Geomonas silvestris]GFO58177.1 hypothetical protein GMST_05020 [Geomonas silvestris]